MKSGKHLVIFPAAATAIPLNYFSCVSAGVGLPEGRLEGYFSPSEKSSLPLIIPVYISYNLFSLTRPERAEIFLLNRKMNISRVMQIFRSFPFLFFF